MVAFASLGLAVLLLSPLGLADTHLRHKRRQHEERNVTLAERFEGSGSNEGHALAKRAFTGRGTFYYTGLGACGIYNNDNDYIVALNSAQYGGGYPGPQCFKYLTIQANGVTVGGVQVTDECPTCDWGGLDLSPGLFKRFADESAGTLALTWWFDGDSGSTPTTTQAATTSTTPAWSPDPVPTSTSTWSQPPTSTSTWVAPSSTSTWVAPSSSSSSSSSTTTFSSFSSSASSISASASNSTNPFAIVSHDNSTSSISLDPSASASASASSSDSVVESPIPTNAGNLVALNGLVASYGQLIVVGAGGHQG